MMKTATNRKTVLIRTCVAETIICIPANAGAKPLAKLRRASLRVARQQPRCSLRHRACPRPLCTSARRFHRHRCPTQRLSRRYRSQLGSQFDATISRSRYNLTHLNLQKVSPGHTCTTSDTYTSLQLQRLTYL